jgi:hypothetical protein
MRKKTNAKKSSFGADLIEGMKLVLAHERARLNWNRCGQSLST